MDINFILVYVMKSIFFISHAHTHMYNVVLTTGNTFNLFPTLATPELIPSSCWFPSSTSSSFLAAFKWVVDTCTLLINLVLQGDGIWCCRKMEVFAIRIAGCGLGQGVPGWMPESEDGHYLDNNDSWNKCRCLPLVSSTTTNYIIIYKKKN